MVAFIDTANTAVAVANAAETRGHTYLANGDSKLHAANKTAFARVARRPAGHAYGYEDHARRRLQ